MGIRAARGESRCSRGWPQPGAVGLSLHRVSPCGRAMYGSAKRTIGSICCVHHRRGDMRRSQCCVEVKRRTSSVSELSPIAVRGRVAGKPGKDEVTWPSPGLVGQSERILLALAGSRLVSRRRHLAALSALSRAIFPRRSIHSKWPRKCKSKKKKLFLCRVSTQTPKP